MTRSQDLTTRYVCRTDRRRWIAGALATIGVGSVAQAVRSASDRMVEVRPVSQLPSEPATFEHLGYRIVAYPSKLESNAPVPIVFLFGGNGMGAVVRSVQADQLAEDLSQRGIAAVVVNYPNLTHADDILSRIVTPMADLLNRPWAKRHRIDVTRVGAAGFSAGGLIATLLATRYRNALPFEIRSALNYYGPVDLKQWFAFHDARVSAADFESIAPVYQGNRGPGDIGRSAHGSIVCRDLSMSLSKKVNENIGGKSDEKLDAFSEPRIFRADPSFEVQHESNAKPRLVGAFGMLDDNCDAVFQPRLLERLGQLHGIEAKTFVYDGPHGVSWRACPKALDSFLEPLQDDAASFGITRVS